MKADVSSHAERAGRDFCRGRGGGRFVVSGAAVSDQRFGKAAVELG